MKVAVSTAHSIAESWRLIHGESGLRTKRLPQAGTHAGSSINPCTPGIKEKHKLHQEPPVFEVPIWK